MSNESPAAALAAMRKKATVTCPQCGQEAEVLARAVYCSSACRWKAANARKRAAQPPKKVWMKY